MYDDRERALTAGFDGFLTKPINTRDLVDILERLQQRR
jgi:CheY-like chemotaxis protein